MSIYVREDGVGRVHADQDNTHVDGIHVRAQYIAESTDGTLLIEGDYWASFTVLAMNSRTNSAGGGVALYDGPKTVYRNNLTASNTWQTVFNSVSHDGSQKNVMMKYLDGNWRIKHNGHGFNYTYTLIFSIG